MPPRCKRAEELDIDNCHEGYEGEEEYCLFHKPDKTEIESRKFYSKLQDFRERISGQKEINIQQNLEYKFEGVDFTGFIFPDSPRGISPIFRFVKFNKIAFFNHAIFEYRPLFSKSVFNAIVSFRNTTFEHGAVFKNTKFKMDAEFQESTFKDGTALKDDISICLILSDSVFEENVNFEKATFKGSILS